MSTPPVPEPTPVAHGLRDYVRWHDDYADPDSQLSRRLRHVQAVISRYLDEHPGDVRVLSLCAGQGHDILGVLEQRPADRDRVTGALVELEPVNARAALQRAESLGVDLEVVQADAGWSDTYAGLVPADLVLLVGIMGNISPADIERLVHTCRQLCDADGVVVWSRGNMEPDLGPDIRRWFAEAGFAEVELADDVYGERGHVGVERLVEEPERLRPGVQVFTFTR